MKKGKEIKEILVVEDSVLARLIVKDIRRGEGYNVAAEVTSEEAVRVDYLVGGIKYGCCWVCKWKDLYTF
ncbi:hypothetical protein [Caldanaerobacter sp.]|uniref:hypothetical protein n=1 Tax=Caldanaerobacter sp. TaxID=2930036 RepID=UPI003C70B597